MEPRTAREVLLARSAYTLGWRSSAFIGCDADKQSALRYPMPTIAVPVVVADEKGTLWRIVDGQIQWKSPGDEYVWQVNRTDRHLEMTFDRIRLLAALIESPTVVVPVDSPLATEAQ